MKRKKWNFLRLVSIVTIISLILTPSAFASFNTAEPDEWAIPDVISAAMENIDISVNDDIITVHGIVKAGNQTFPFSSQVAFYRIESEDAQDGKFIANVLASDGYSLINLSLGAPSATMMSQDVKLRSAKSVTRLALMDREHNRIFSVEQPSDYIHVTMVQELAQPVKPSDDLYETLMQNESWYNTILRQEIRNSIEFKNVDVNELESINSKGTEEKIDQRVNPVEARQKKGEYETLKEQNTSADIGDAENSSAALAAGYSPSVEASIRSCVNYVGANKFKTPNATYQRVPTYNDPTGYYMETTKTSCDYIWCIQNNPDCLSVETRIIGYQIVNMAPKDDLSNSSFTYIRLEIIWDYYIAYYSCHNEIVLIMEESGFRFRNMKLAMSTDDDSTDFFYRIWANAKTRNGVGNVSNPLVNLALKVIPGGQKINLGINIWNGLYYFFSNVTANGQNGSADKTWSAVPSTHQQQMKALTGNAGYNRVAEVECLQGFDDKWLGAKGHYVYLDAYVQSTGSVRQKRMQYSYKFEICTQNAINFFYTIKTVDTYFYRSYCR